MTKMLRHTITGEVFPVNPALQKAENMEVIEVPSDKDFSEVVTLERGNAVIRDAVEAVEAAPDEPAKPKKKAAPRKKAAAKDDVDLSGIDLPDDAA